MNLKLIFNPLCAVILILPNVSLATEMCYPNIETAIEDRMESLQPGYYDRTDEIAVSYKIKPVATDQKFDYQLVTYTGWDEDGDDVNASVVLKQSKEDGRVACADDFFNILDEASLNFNGASCLFGATIDDLLNANPYKLSLIMHSEETFLRHKAPGLWHDGLWFKGKTIEILPQMTGGLKGPATKYVFYYQEGIDGYSGYFIDASNNEPVAYMIHSAVYNCSVAK